MPQQRISRRKILYGTAFAAVGLNIVPRHVVAGSGQTPPSERLNLAFIGSGGRARANLAAFDELQQNFVAMCDVDDERAAESYAKYPRPKKHRDFRRMLGELDRQIDAVVVSTPDHTHAMAALAAIRQGKHVYCEKPLAHSIGEVRALREAARRAKVITQMGNQGHSFDHIRMFCEWIWDGAIGNVHTVHAFYGRDYSRINKLPLLAEHPPVPTSLDWDLWLGPAAARPYSPEYVAGKWRGWLNFGTGALGDWICHIVDPVFWALDLGAPEKITATAEGYDVVKHAESYPAATTVKYEFAARGKRGPVTLYWYDGAAQPPQPKGWVPKKDYQTWGCFVLGDKGSIHYGTHGARGVRIFPEEQMLAYKRPEPTLPRVKNHHVDWLDAIRGNRQAGSNFDYGGPLSEIALLGLIAIRHVGTTLTWDSAAARVTNCDEANRWVSPPPREGWYTS